MPANYPPVPLYPNNYDSTYTLLGVHNTVETITVVDNDAWSQEIQIKPVAYPTTELGYPALTITDDGGLGITGVANEIWSYYDTNADRWVNNGFATIGGELLYYDSVIRDDTDRVIALNNCIRNLGGSQTQFNSAGTDIRSFVIAEHHNQIAQAIIQIEQYLNTLCLPTVPSCNEDGGCPNASFQYTTTTPNNQCQSVEMSYQLSISGNANNVQLDFGDGGFTTLPTNGTHTYASGASVNPVVTVGNDNCQIVVAGATPQVVTPESTFEIPVVIPSIPTISIAPVNIPLPDISIPPLVMPCIDLEPINIDIGPISIDVPSAISLVVPSIPNISLIVPSIPNVSMIIPSFAQISISFPSVANLSLVVPSIPNISLIVPTIPTTINLVGPDPSLPDEIEITGGDLPSVISIDGGDMPSVISVDSDIPDTITVDSNIPSVISVDGVSNISVVGLSNISVVGLSNISVAGLSNISLICTNCPSISVIWGTPPTVSCNVSVTCPSVSGHGLRAIVPDDLEWDELGSHNLEVAYDVGGIPSKIEIEAPKIPAIQIDASSVPTKITVESPNIPERISVTGVENMVSEIKVLIPDKLPAISIDASSVPTSIPIDWGDIPTHIGLTVLNMPSVLSIEHDIPSVISVEGVPDIISVVGLPQFLPIKFENENDRLLRVEPIDVKVTVDINKLITSDAEGHTCFFLTPCNST